MPTLTPLKEPVPLGIPVEGGATIERHVPVLPMSRGTQHYRRLLKTLGAYRLAVNGK